MGWKVLQEGLPVGREAPSSQPPCPACQAPPFFLPSDSFTFVFWPLAFCLRSRIRSPSKRRGLGRPSQGAV